MIEEVGIVVSVQGNTAQVEGQRRSTCGSCTVNGACGTSLLARYLGRKRLLLRVQNSIGAEPGDRVVVGLPEGALLTASSVAYLIPLLAMIGGAMSGAYVAGLVVPTYVEALSVLAGLGGFAVALAWIHKFSLARSSDERYRPRILRPDVLASQGRAVRFQDPGVRAKHDRGGA